MLIHAVSIFPEMFSSVCDYGVVGRAKQKGLWDLQVINPRDFADNKLGYIDDRPFGGGPGMIMMASPLWDAVQYAQSCHKRKVPVLCLSPQGKPLEHSRVEALSLKEGMILLCGRYEGIDERLLEAVGAEEIAIGDFVVSGGELPAMMLIDAVVRLLPGVLGDERSAEEDSFAQGLLDCPHYTRPFDFRGVAVPDVLRSGDHKAIATWRLKSSLRRTMERRPDLFGRRVLSPEESRLVEEILNEQQDKSILE